MSSPLTTLEPKRLWHHFDRIRRIPRASGDETGIAEYIVRWAREHGWKVRRDKVGNLCVQVPATPGRERVGGVVLQAHLDMVCEKDTDADFDFSRSAIQAEVDGDWVVSKRTTLGADNGIGVAAALAIVEDADAPHGPVELLFTVDEEATVEGAKKLDGSLVTSRRMLNLDSENDEELVVGCAGGADVEIEYGARRSAAQEGYVAMRLGVRGLRGGHSGLSIHENRGNAIKILARILRRSLRTAELYVWSIEGGNKPTAIPREASALILVPAKQLDTLQAVAGQTAQAFLSELGDLDGGLEVSFEKADAPDLPPMDCSSTRRLVRLLNALPHGVQAMARDEPQRVYTSANLAAVRTDVDRVTITMSARSMLAWGLEGMLNQIDATSRLAGAATEEIAAYPPWLAPADSKMVELANRIYGEVFSKEPRLSSIHAGVECGVIGERVPDMDMVSFGPLIEDAHAPGERVSIASVQRFHLFLSRMLGALT